MNIRPVLWKLILPLTLLALMGGDALLRGGGGPPPGLD
jgi:hypothetical protein